MRTIGREKEENNRGLCGGCCCYHSDIGGWCQLNGDKVKNVRKKRTWKDISCSPLSIFVTLLVVPVVFVTPIITLVVLMVAGAIAMVVVALSLLPHHCVAFVNSLECSKLDLHKQFNIILVQILLYFTSTWIYSSSLSNISITSTFSD